MTIVSLQSRLVSGADAGNLHLPSAGQPTAPAAKVPPFRPQIAAARQQPAAISCQQTLTISFFFDGTGNNLDADVNSWEHSNVARLYRAHLDDSETAGLFSFYLPGIGTYFKDREVNDPGGKLTGKAFGALGQARLNFAFARLREKVAKAEARAENPTNKICWIKVSAFGFSRGAALARAFCRDLQERCTADASSPTGWRLKQGNHPIEIGFLGLFDTVASAGLPPSSNNLQRNRYVRAAGALLPMPIKLARKLLVTPELKRLAFDASPGADPAPGIFDGHGDWAEGLAIGSMVKSCTHYMAAHENRNSFALDTTLFYDRTETAPGKITEFFKWPDVCAEQLYPGVHSDVGGGYRPGEGGCKQDRGAQLSLIPLRAMHTAALAANVPLRALAAMRNAEQREEFAIDEAGSAHYAAMLVLFDYYKSAAEKYAIAGATNGLGLQINQHMRAYYSWRFQAIQAKQTGKGVTTEQEQQVARNEAQFAKDRAAIDAELKKARTDLYMAQNREELARIFLENAQMNKQRYDTPVPPAMVQNHQQARLDTERKQIAYDRIRARKEGAANDSQLNAAISRYDKMLLDDAKAIVFWMRETPTMKLRPHYRALVEAYLDEFERNQGMRDAKLIEFFNEYVHDSLAGFDTDETWPSDPRILYVGGDNKLRYASADKPLGAQESQAA
jgi:hypothetical protein